VLCAISNGMKFETKPQVGSVEKEKKVNRVELSNGVYFDVREKSRGVYEVVDLGQSGQSHKGMILEVKPKKRQFEDMEDPEHEQWEQAAGSSTHFKYKDTEFDFSVGGGEIRASSLKEIRELADKLDIDLVDPADRDY